jgi:hypothetical protein
LDAPRDSPSDASERDGRLRELRQIEAAIEDKEREVAELERRLADDWANLDTAAAYRRARGELDAMLVSWERLYGTAYS